MHSLSEAWSLSFLWYKLDTYLYLSLASYERYLLLVIYLDGKAIHTLTVLLT